jgi:hypothetical protein
MSYHVIPSHHMSYHVIPSHHMSYHVIPSHLIPSTSLSLLPSLSILFISHSLHLLLTPNHPPTLPPALIHFYPHSYSIPLLLTPTPTPTHSTHSHSYSLTSSVSFLLYSSDLPAKVFNFSRRRIRFKSGLK